MDQSWTGNGKIGGALSFDGVIEYFDFLDTSDCWLFKNQSVSHNKPFGFNAYKSKFHMVQDNLLKSCVYKKHGTQQNGINSFKFRIMIEFIDKFSNTGLNLTGEMGTFSYNFMKQIFKNFTSMEL